MPGGFLIVIKLAENLVQVGSSKESGFLIVIKLAENLDPTESCGDECDIRAISPRILNLYSARQSSIYLLENCVSRIQRPDIVCHLMIFQSAHTVSPHR